MVSSIHKFENHTAKGGQLSDTKRIRKRSRYRSIYCTISWQKNKANKQAA